MKILSVITLGLLLTACATQQPKYKQPTQACMEYQAMMTAPMPPDAVERLRVKCELSNQ